MSDNCDNGSPSRGAHYVAKGLMKVSGEPISLQTVVGPGYVIAIRLDGRNGGGLLHIPYEETEIDSQSLAGSQAKALLNKFHRALEKIMPELKDAEANIIGGADILRLLPSAKRERIIAERAAPLGEEISRWGIKNIRLKIGGEKGRKVIFDIASGVLKVAPTGELRSARSKVKSPGKPLFLSSVNDLTVNMGCLQIAHEPVRLQAILGSCVGVALYDRQKKIGGLVHVMMPLFPGKGEPRSKYADTAVPELVQNLIEAGANRNRLKAKIAGGANVLFSDVEGNFNHISLQNVLICRDALIAAGIEIVEENVGGRIGRKMIVDLSTFKMSIKMLTGADIQE